MRLYLRHGGEVRRLPKPIQDYIRRTFSYTPEALTLLRCFEYNGEVKGKQVKRISVFSPVSAEEKHLIIKTRQDLEQYHDILLFEGYIDRQGKAYVADRRTPVKKPKIARTS